MLQLGLPEEALKILDSCSDDWKNSKSFHIIRYRIFRKLDRLPEALREVENFREKFPSDEFGLKALEAVSVSISKFHIKEYTKYYSKQQVVSDSPTEPLLLNIGAGDTFFKNFIGLDFDSDH